MASERLPERYVKDARGDLIPDRVQRNFEHLERRNTRGPAVFAGAVMPTAGATAPTGWLLCDGAAVSRTTYSALFAAISTYYGAGDGSTTFNVPNLKGRVPVGIDTGQTEFDTRGETGGAKTHTLTVGQIPAHTHSLLLGWGAGSNFRAQAGVALADFGTTGTIYDTLETNGSAPAGGNGQAHNNLQPYIALNYVICTG